MSELVEAVTLSDTNLVGGTSEVGLKLLRLIGRPRPLVKVSPSGPSPYFCRWKAKASATTAGSGTTLFEAARFGGPNRGAPFVGVTS